MKIKKKLLLAFNLLFSVWFVNAQQLNVDRIDPPFWWSGMKNPKVELLVKGNGIGNCKVEIVHPGIDFTTENFAENKNYIIVSLNIDRGVKAGKFPIKFSKEGKTVSFVYELKERQSRSATTVDATDLIYLIMPDRFANGDTKNDVIKTLQETSVNRDSMFYRHGGDLQGVIDHLDYIRNVGATAIWLNPVQENDQPWQSYHGYAITDHYKIDARFGNNEKYVELVSKSHEKNLKVIMDLVFNHFGNQHYLYKDLPSSDWIHQQDTFVRTSYRAPVLMDPYVSEFDKKIMTDGWFDHHMPDVNQQNKQLANYFIQNCIWWIEYAGIDGFRIDTYAYSDQQFMSDWAAAIFAEYPGFGMFGETWVHGIPVQSFFTEKPGREGLFDSKLPGVTDFQLYYAINEALANEQGWTEGVSRIYYTLAQDFVYNNPTKNVIFLDNHDLSRFYSMVGEDINKYKIGIAILLTTRGIPMLYYGTEILMKNYAGPDGKVREDFPGGWQGDSQNKFTREGRTDKENEAFDFVSKLANYRKDNAVLQTGRLMQFVPENGVYVYFRYNSDKTVMVVVNTSKENRRLETERFTEMTKGFSKVKNVVTDKITDLPKKIDLPVYSVVIWELER